MTNLRTNDSTHFAPQPTHKILVRISGEIKNYVKRRDEASFVFTENDKNTMGVIAIVATLGGLGGQATAIASNASALDEAADYVEFEIGENAIKGWLWRSPFSEGDIVDVAAEWQGEYYEVFGIARPSDRVIALYPHCSRSRISHIKNALKWWAIISVGVHTAVFIINYLTIGDIDKVINFWDEFFTEYLGGLWILGLVLTLAVPVASLAMKWMPFVTVAEKVFKTLGLPNSGDIDLVRSSKEQVTKQDPPELGIMYFKY